MQIRYVNHALGVFSAFTDVHKHAFIYREGRMSSLVKVYFELEFSLASALRDFAAEIHLCLFTCLFSIKLYTCAGFVCVLVSVSCSTGSRIDVCS